MPAGFGSPVSYQNSRSLSRPAKIAPLPKKKAGRSGATTRARLVRAPGRLDGITDGTIGGMKMAVGGPVKLIKKRKLKGGRQSPTPRSRGQTEGHRARCCHAPAAGSKVDAMRGATFCSCSLAIHAPAPFWTGTCPSMPCGDWSIVCADDPRWSCRFLPGPALCAGWRGSPPCGAHA